MMRCGNRLFFSVVLIFLSLTGVGHAGPDANLMNVFKNLQSGKPQVLVAYGTSLTALGAWVGAVQQWFDAKYPHLVTVINNGMKGQNSDAGVAHLQDKVLDHHPDLVFLEFAYNDAHVRFKLTPEHCADNLDQIVRGIRAQNPQAAIVLQTMNVGWDSPTAFKAESERPQLDAYYDNYRHYARDHGLPLVDNEPNWLKLKQTDPAKYHAYLPDGNHPNRTASLEITWPAVKTLLEAADAAAGTR